MIIKINGEEVEAPVGTTLEDIFIKKNLQSKLSTFEMNSKIIPRQQYPDIVLKEGDEVGIIKLYAGG